MMKIQPNYARAYWRNHRYIHKSHRPPARLHRDHHRLAETMRRALLTNGHRCTQRYIAGRTWFWCQRCGKRFELKLNMRTLPVIATCVGDVHDPTD
jgi:hypothetical protein